LRLKKAKHKSKKRHELITTFFYSYVKLTLRYRKREKAGYRQAV